MSQSMNATGRRPRPRSRYTVFFGDRSLWQTTSSPPASPVPAVRSWSSRTSSATRTRLSADRTSAGWSASHATWPSMKLRTSRPCSSTPRYRGAPEQPCSSRWRSRLRTNPAELGAGRRTVAPTRTTAVTKPPDISCSGAPPLSPVTSASLAHRMPRRRFQERSAQVKHQACLYPALLHLLEALVDLVQAACLADHPGASQRVELEDLGQVGAGTDDRADDGDAVEHGLEDGQPHVVVRRQRDEDERATAAQGPVRLLERLRRDGDRDCGIGTAELLDGLDRVLHERVHRVVGAELAGELELLVDQVHRDDRGAEDLGVLRVAAVQEVAGVELLLAQRLPAGVAVLAGAAGVTEPRQGDPVAGGYLGHPGTEALHDPDPLVAGDEGQVWLDRPVAVRGVDVGVAQAGGLDPDDDLTRARLGFGYVLDQQRFGEVVDDGGFHGGSPYLQGPGLGTGSRERRTAR